MSGPTRDELMDAADAFAVKVDEQQAVIARLAEALKGAEAAMHRVLNTRLDYDPEAFIELKQAHEVTRAALREAGVADE